MNQLDEKIFLEEVRSNSSGRLGPPASLIVAGDFAPIQILLTVYHPPSHFDSSNRLLDMGPKTVAKTEKKSVAKAKGDKPKRASSPYILFSTEKRAEVKAQNPDASFGELGKILGQMWSQMDEKAKAVSELARQEFKYLPLPCVCSHTSRDLLISRLLLRVLKRLMLKLYLVRSGLNGLPCMG
jgi:hypothetical protein